MLFLTKRFSESLDLLKELRDVVPKEPALWILMGNCYKELKDQKNSLLCYQKAVDLDAKDHNAAKSHIEKLMDAQNFESTENVNIA